MSTAELIELENWVIKLRDRFDAAEKDDRSDMHTQVWLMKYPELPERTAARERLYENLRLLIAEGVMAR